MDALREERISGRILVKVSDSATEWKDMGYESTGFVNNKDIKHDTAYIMCFQG